jgi:hypothetical protein
MDFERSNVRTVKLLLLLLLLLTHPILTFTTGIRGTLSSGITSMRQRIADYWQRMGSKDPDSFQHRVSVESVWFVDNLFWSIEVV